MREIWVKHKSTNVRSLVSEFGVYEVSIFGMARHVNDLFEFFTYLDGSLCGMKED